MHFRQAKLLHTFIEAFAGFIKGKLPLAVSHAVLPFTSVNSVTASKLHCALPDTFAIHYISPVRCSIWPCIHLEMVVDSVQASCVAMKAAIAWVACSLIALTPLPVI